MVRWMRVLLYRCGVRPPWGIDPEAVSLATIRAHERYLQTRGVEQAVSARWPWPTQKGTD